MTFSHPQRALTVSIGLCFSVFCLLSQPVLAATIKTEIDRNPVSINESFQLTYTATQTADGNPDFSPLHAQFTIISRSQSSQLSGVNGNWTQSTKWILTVAAKDIGQLTIPPIAFGKDRSQAKKIKVVKAAPANTGSTKALFVEAEVSSKKPYVQSQVLYTLRLYSRQDVNGRLINKPTLAHALIEELPRPKNYQKTVNGVIYTVIELRYAIFPQKSGKATIKPMELTAETGAARRPSFNSFFNQQPTKVQRLVSSPINLEVQAAPTTFKAKHWMAAEQVTMHQEWSGDTSQVKVGEPITRTLRLRAQGALSAQLPELHRASADPQLKTYPDQPILKQDKTVDGVSATRTEKIAYIPSKAGSYTLPALKIAWFNTRKKRTETVSIPATTLVATGAPASTTTHETAIPMATLDTTDQPAIADLDRLFWIGLSCLLALGWLATVLVWHRQARPKQRKSPISRRGTQLKESVEKLKQACQRNDQLAAKNALLVWGKLSYNSNNLATLAAQCEPPLSTELDDLSQHLYAAQATAWQGANLWGYFSQHKVAEKALKSTTDALPPLHKI